jgi:hypothetical protein
VRFAGNIGAEPETHVLLAMQKVEGSNPFSRSLESGSTERQTVSRSACWSRPCEAISWPAAHSVRSLHPAAQPTPRHRGDRGCGAGGRRLTNRGLSPRSGIRRRRGSAGRQAHERRVEVDVVGTARRWCGVSCELVLTFRPRARLISDHFGASPAIRRHSDPQNRAGRQLAPTTSATGTDSWRSSNRAARSRPSSGRWSTPWSSLRRARPGALRCVRESAFGARHDTHAGLIGYLA